MISGSSALAKLYIPLLTAVVIGFAASRATTGMQAGHISIAPFGGLIGIDVPVQSRSTLCLALALIAAVCLFIYAVLDYSDLFVSHFHLDVFYDEPGLREAIRELRIKSTVSKLLAAADERHREKHLASLDNEIRKVAHIDCFFTTAACESIYSTGETSFKVAKTRGLQQYRIVESSGHLTHTREVAGRKAIHLYTLFEHLPSAADHLRFGWREVLLGIVLAPQFKQILAEDRTSDSVIYRAQVVGLTYIRIFPWPCVSRTVYCAIGETEIYPIAYAVHS